MTKYPKAILFMEKPATWQIGQNEFAFFAANAAAKDWIHQQNECLLLQTIEGQYEDSFGVAIEGSVIYERFLKLTGLGVSITALGPFVGQTTTVELQGGFVEFGYTEAP